MSVMKAVKNSFERIKTRKIKYQWKTATLQVREGRENI